MDGMVKQPAYICMHTTDIYLFPSNGMDTDKPCECVSVCECIHIMSICQTTITKATAKCLNLHK